MTRLDYTLTLFLAFAHIFKTCLQIILRARQGYLFQTTKDATPALSAELIANVKNAWKQYADSKLERINPDASKDWLAFKAQMTPDAVLKALAIDEKFKMHFTALVSHLFLFLLSCFEKS